MSLLREGSRGSAVVSLQQALNSGLRPSPGLAADGVFGPRTKAAVIAFQRQTRIGVDGIVGPQTNGALRAASGGGGAPSANPGGGGVPAGSAPAAPTQPGSSTEYFPFATMTSWSWTSGARAFASNRSSGARAHAGCDLYYPQGTKIYAVKDGTVVRGPYYFYANTYAIEVDHGTFLARYGEIQSNAQVKVGDSVSAGQHIAQVGHLVGINVPSDMLHFEMYSNTSSGSLSVSGGGRIRSDGIPFNRRGDLIDCTAHLNNWQNNLPTAR